MGIQDIGAGLILLSLIWAVVAYFGVMQSSLTVSSIIAFSAGVVLIAYGRN